MNKKKKGTNNNNNLQNSEFFSVQYFITSTNVII